jgi:DNA-binding MarR family transcriptional regulator
MSSNDDPTIGFIDGYLAYLLAQASHLISHEFHAVVRSSGLSVLQWRVLATLADGSTRSVGEVATIALTPQSTLTRVVDRMSELGLVKRVADGLDRRVTRLRITPKGARMSRKLVEMAREHEATVLAPMDAAQAAAFKSALLQLIETHLPAAKGTAAARRAAKPVGKAATKGAAVKPAAGTAPKPVARTGRTRALAAV